MKKKKKHSKVQKTRGIHKNKENIKGVDLYKKNAYKHGVSDVKPEKQQKRMGGQKKKKKKSNKFDPRENENLSKINLLTILLKKIIYIVKTGRVSRIYDESIKSF